MRATPPSAYGLWAGLPCVRAEPAARPGRAQPAAAAGCYALGEGRVSGERAGGREGHRALPETARRSPGLTPPACYAFFGV